MRQDETIARISRKAMLFAVVGAAALMSACGSSNNNDDAAANAALVAQGKQTFRFDTFGDEQKWTDTLHMEQVVNAVDPTTALTVGLKVDAEALPQAVVDAVSDPVNGPALLKDPATTVALIKLNAVVGVKGTVEKVNGVDTVTRVGFTCALCHSTVDNSFATGIGKRLDGWPNRDLNVGFIVSLSPNLQALADALGTDVATVKAVLTSWGPGKYDPRLNFDKQNGPQVIPPAFGLAGIHSITATGDGTDVAYWNRYVAVTQMGGQGTFSEPRTGVDFNGIPNGGTDLVSSKLAGLQAYQLSLAAPTPPANSFDAAAAARGQVLFAGIAGCASCHSGPDFTDANTTLHPVSDSMGEPEAPGVPSYASRSATKKYRTAPLAGLWTHEKGGFFHNGSAATLDDVVSTYNTRRSLGLTAPQMADLVQYLKSL